MASKVLLFSPPFRTPSAANLALATLGPVLARAGIASDTLHGSLLFPRSATDPWVLGSYSTWLFVPHLYPDDDPARARSEAVDALVARYLNDLNLSGLRLPREAATLERLGVDEGKLRADVLADMDRAEVCLQRCLTVAGRAEYDVVAISCTFETQMPAVLAFARRLKAARPEVKIVLGGAACFGETADALALGFRCLDAVCHAEGEAVIAPLVRAARGQLPLAQVPGIAYVDRGLVRRTAAPPLLRDLDELPPPEYDDFLRQHQQSEWRDLPPELFFETSRGCWWGEKHLCTFCGLNAEGLAFRQKSPARAFEEIRALYQDHPTVPRLQATDNILPLSYLSTVLPRLARLPQQPGRPLNLFFEVKSNFTRDQVRALAQAGIYSVQPGIESFSDEVLELMDKGATGLGQVQFIKWATEAGVQLIYNMLLRNPGERAADYHEMLELLPFIEHLPPPTGISPVWLERFSPYYLEPARFGITNLRPKPWYPLLYRGPRVDLMKLAFAFDYDHPILEDAELFAVQRELVRRLDRWTEGFRPGMAYYVDEGDRVIVYDQRGAGPTTEVLSGAAARVFRYLDKVRPLALLRSHFAELDPVLLECLLLRMVRQRQIFWARSDRLLSVLPRRERDLRAPRPGGSRAA